MSSACLGSARPARLLPVESMDSERSDPSEPTLADLLPFLVGGFFREKRSLVVLFVQKLRDYRAARAKTTSAKSTVERMTNHDTNWNISFSSSISAGMNSYKRTVPLNSAVERPLTLAS